MKSQDKINRVLMHKETGRLCLLSNVLPNGEVSRFIFFVGEGYYHYPILINIEEFIELGDL